MVQVVLDGWRLVTDEAGSERFRQLPTDRGHALSTCGVSRRALSRWCFLLRFAAATRQTTESEAAHYRTSRLRACVMAEPQLATATAMLHARNIREEYLRISCRTRVFDYCPLLFLQRLFSG